MERMTVRGSVVSQRDINRLLELSDENQFGANNAYYKLKHYEDLEEQGRLIEVVKCKDCSCFEEITAAYNYYFCNRYGGIVTENDYCSRAEAKLKELKEGAE